VDPLIERLLSGRGRKGTIPGPPYRKWTGSHWVLTLLADLGHPAGDRRLRLIAEQVYQLALASPTLPRFQVIQGRVRWHASIEGNALFALTTLGFADPRADRIAENLMEWQWPDGGWNCDLRPQAIHSSFHETLAPLRGLNCHARRTGSSRARRAVRRAAELFLARNLFRRRRGGGVIDPRFLKLHYPSYYHYDILHCLKVLAEAGFIADPRCGEALEVLESKRLSDGGFPAEGKHYQTQRKDRPLYSTVDWGGVSRRRGNLHVTRDALKVLAAAGR
jgi:hypothetical protein